MKELIEYIGTYNLFNYLLPGVVFSVVVENSTSFNLLPNDIILIAFVCYFIGMIISRVGSIIIEPLLKSLKFIKFKEYSDFVNASKKDSMIEVISEKNNTYRTIISMILLIFLSKLYEWIIEVSPFLEGISLYIIFFVLLVLFLLAYRKQTAYITKRIDENLN